MSDRDPKTLLNEILPDPTAAARDLKKGGPRERTRDHLKKILAAAAGLAIAPSLAHADASVPPGGKDGKNDNGKKEVPAQKPPPPPPPGYLVVDPIPRPPDRNGQPGWVVVESKTRGAHIAVDGKDTGKRTPSARIQLQPGYHSIALSAPGYETQVISVEVWSGETTTEHHDLKPVASKKKDDAKHPPKPDPAGK